ncbi:MAG: staygreen family protein, partial [Deltaproteobacteria bacterium]|nr:staygreen family protein [Deltaproteobacteria bacterium]
MTRLIPEKLRIIYSLSVTETDPITPRRYTLTHSDATGELTLTIGGEYDRVQVSGWYTRLMRDEVFAEWIRRFDS